jgi:hypothetical protein
MSADAGKWVDWTNRAREITGSSLNLAPVFFGEVAHKERDGEVYWWAMLNGQIKGGFPSLAQAKARVDWEIWNSVRLIVPGYKNLLSRRADWINGSS